MNTPEYDKFVHSLLHRKLGVKIPEPLCVIYNSFKQQSKYDFGDVPLSDQVMRQVQDINRGIDIGIVELHERVKSAGVPNFLGARIPDQSQLNIEK